MATPGDEEIERRPGPVEPAPQAEQIDGLQPSTAELVTAWEAHSGPLPPGRWFEAIERLHPGATEMIVKDYTAEREHQRELQKEALRLDEVSLNSFGRYQLLRLLIVGSLAAILAIGGIALIATGHGVYGLVLLVGEIAAMVLAFFGRRRHVDDGSEDGGSEIGPV